jgi:RNA polymerase sigma-70 factor (ECF subfamily)
MSGLPGIGRTAPALPRSDDGARRGLDGLFRSEAPRLLRFFRRKTGNGDMAADMVQETFLRLAGLDHSDFRNPAAYLQRIARNLLIDRAKRAETRLLAHHVPFDEHIDSPVAPDQMQLIEARDTLSQFEQAIVGMTPKSAEIFLLHRVDGLTYDEIRERMGLSLGAIEYHIMRALAHIDMVMGEE